MHAYILTLVFILIRLIYLRKFGRVTGEPYTPTNILVAKLIENAITSKNNKVVLLRNLVDSDLRLCFYNIGIASPVFKFGFWIPESAANREPPWKDSNWTDYVFWVLRL